MNEQFIAKLTKIVEANLQNEQFGVSELAHEIGMNRSSLHRKLKTITGKSISQFIRETRLNRAKELLEKNDKTATDVAYLVGFGSVTYFSKCFHDFYGFPPGKLNENTNEQKNITVSKISIYLKSKKFGYYPFVVGSVLIAIFLVYLFYIQVKLSNKHPENSIAVPTFIQNNVKEEDALYADVVREELITKLSLIKNFKVPLKATTDKFYTSDLNYNELGKKLNVNFILSGNTRNVNNKTWIHFELIETSNEKICWSRNYEIEVTDNNIFTLQEEVAISVANELNTILSPQERELIQFQNTYNVTAYNYYQRAEKYMEFYDLENNVENREMARQYYEKSIQFDPEYPLPYVGLGWYYFHLSNAAFEIKMRSFSNSELLMPKNFDIAKTQIYLDSAMVMAENAIKLNSNSYGAYILKGQIYTEKGMFDKATDVLNKAIQINPNNYEAYEYMALNYSRTHNFSEAIKWLLISRKFNKEPLENIWILRALARNLRLAGFPEIAKIYLDALLKQENDSIEYYIELCYGEIGIGRPEEALKYMKLAYQQDTTNLNSISLMAWSNMYLRNKEEMHKYYNKFNSALKQYNIIPEPNLYYSYFYSLFGSKEEADYNYINTIRYNEAKNLVGHPQAKIHETAYHLACIYAARGEKEKAMQNLRFLKNKQRCADWVVTYFNIDPMLDNIREEPEFKEIYKHIKTVYLEEHEKVKDVLIKAGIISPD